jgi:predicted anti-sigma-YlaC factor YlaD
MKRLLARFMKPDPRECEEVRALFSDYLDADLDPGGRRRIEEHVRFCRRCRRVLGNLRHTLAGVRGLGDRQPAEADEIAERVQRAWREHG